MIKVIVYLAIGLILTTFEATFLNVLPIDFFKPDLGIPLVIYTTFFLGPQAGLITSVFIGLMQEIVSSSPSGSLLFTKVAIFIISVFMRNKIFIDSKYSFSFVCSGAVLVESFLFLALTFLARGESRDAFNVAFYSIPNAIFTGFLSLLLFSLIGFLNVRYLNRQ
jgi:rod shape-determining protein MreD